MITTRKIVEKSKQGGADLAASLEDIRRSIVSAQYELGQIDRAPTSKDEAFKRVDEWVAKVGDTSAAIDAFISRFTGEQYREPPQETPGFILAAAMTASIAALLRNGIERRFASLKIGEGLSASDRELRRVEMGATLFDLEMAEEAIIRSAEGFGINLLRRIDADPRVVLCKQEYLR